MNGVLSATASQIVQEGVWNSLASHVWEAGTNYFGITAYSFLKPVPVFESVNSDLALVLIVVGKICDLIFGNKTTQKDGAYKAYFVQSIVLTGSVAADFWKDSRAFYAVMAIGLLAIASGDHKEKKELLGMFLVSTLIISTVASTIFLLRGQLTTVGVLSLAMYASSLRGGQNGERTNSRRGATTNG